MSPSDDSISEPLPQNFFIIYLAALVEKADEALLPAVYNEVAKTFNCSPTALGTLTLARALSQALANPLAAYLALTHDRTVIVTFGTVIWAVSTSLGGFSLSYSHVRIFFVKHEGRSAIDQL